MSSIPTDRPDGEALPLSPEHAAELRASGLSADAIRAAGLHTVADGSRVQELLGGYLDSKTANRMGACLAFPFLDATGAPMTYPHGDGSVHPFVRLKPSKPRTGRDGKPHKYESPLRCGNRAYLPPGARPALADAGAALLLTEGEKKALKATQDGFACLGLVGVEGWSAPRAKDEDGKKTGPRELLPELASIEWTGRKTFIVFDSDIGTKPDVQRAELALAEALRARGADVRVVRLPAEADGAKNGLDDFLVRRGADALRLLLSVAQPPAPGAKAKAAKAKPPSAADALTAIALERFALWHDGKKTGFASCGRRTFGVRAREFRLVLTEHYRKRTGKTANGEALGSALAAIEAAAVFDGEEHEAHVRVAEHQGRVFYHLADERDTVIEIDAAGWRACDNPPVRFRRPPSMLPIPAPVPGGNLDELRRFLNCPDDSAFALVKAWITAAFRPAGPFPPLVTIGEQGSAKTTTAIVLKRLIDPSAAETRCAPKCADDLLIAARNGWLVVFDNLSHLPEWLSDSLCRLATGGGLSKRELYSDADEVVIEAKRPCILNGIEDVVTRGDLLDRSILARHPAIAENRRREESALWAEFHAARPRLLGAVLDRVAAGLRELPRVKLDRLPRMADFAIFATACERGAAEPPTFAAAYHENRHGAQEAALEDSSVPPAVLSLVKERGSFTGPAKELLLDALLPFTTNPPPKDFPKAPNALTNKLRRLAPSLRVVHGLNVDCDRRTTGHVRSRLVTIAQPDEDRDSSSAPPAPSDTPPTTASRVDDADGADGESRTPSASGEQIPAPGTKPTRRRFANDDRPHERRD